VAYVRHWLSCFKVTALYGDFIAKGQNQVTCRNQLGRSPRLAVNALTKL
jgi:hypothetical protein